MKKYVLIFLAILVGIKLVTFLGFTEAELVIAGIIFAFYLLIQKIEELQERIKTLEYKKENIVALEERRNSQAVVEEKKGSEE